MNTTVIISMIITAIITSLVSPFMADRIKVIKEKMPIKKRQVKIITMLPKYAFLILFSILIFLYIDFSKWFVLSIGIVVLIFLYNIARDVFIYLMWEIVLGRDLDKINEDIEFMKDQLANCDRKDKERIAKIKNKIKELEEQKELL